MDVFLTEIISFSEQINWEDYVKYHLMLNLELQDLGLFHFCRIYFTVRYYLEVMWL